MVGLSFPSSIVGPQSPEPLEEIVEEEERELCLEWWRLLEVTDREVEAECRPVRNEDGDPISSSCDERSDEH